MRIGIIIIIVSIVWYIAHAVIYNHYLQKNNPGLFDDLDDRERQHGNKRRRREVQVIITSGQTPAWVALLGMPPIPLFFLGVLIAIIGFIVSLFK